MRTPLKSNLVLLLGPSDTETPESEKLQRSDPR